MLLNAGIQTYLLEVPIGFSVAMSCALANRVILNVRRVNRDIEQSGIGFKQPKGPGSTDTPLDIHLSFLNPSSSGPLTDIEMSQLRSLRSEHGHSNYVVV